MFPAKMEMGTGFDSSAIAAFTISSTGLRRETGFRQEIMRSRFV